MIYVHTAFPNNVYALDLNDNQKIVWSYFPKQCIPQAVLCCDNVNGGWGFGDGKVFSNRTTACWSLWTLSLVLRLGSKDTDPKVGATNTNAPHIIKDKVLTRLFRC
jgi:hypothetical protein